ncbi:MAG: 4-hydroxythreonine-4-phosphate dehydrogenase PdxA [Pirellulaceae bacterium]
MSEAKSSQPVPVLGLTMGDPAGVGPELVLHALGRHAELKQNSQTSHGLVVLGDISVLEWCASELGLPMPEVECISHLDFLKTKKGSQSSPISTLDQGCNNPLIVDHACISKEDFSPGGVSKRCGEASFRYIQTSIEAALLGRLDAVTTGPINKTAIHAAGHTQYPGHTEMFAERTQIEEGRWCMMQYSPAITCTFVTVHCGLSDVASSIHVENVWNTIALTHETLTSLLGRTPRIVVCGLNPHAGEGGLFGNREEELSICPAIERARQFGMDIDGPLPPDTAFVPWKREATDAFVCMYHDQGHIPLKALAFDEAVNTTLGLKVVRTSVDHGTAFDIAWKGKVRPNSLFAALDLAARMSHNQHD